VRVGRALQAHARQRSNGFEAYRHALAIDGVRFMDEFREQLRETTSVLQPFGGFVQEIVRIDVRIRPTIRAVCSR
jgi:hypothetical protein